MPPVLQALVPTELCMPPVLWALVPTELCMPPVLQDLVPTELDNVWRSCTFITRKLFPIPNWWGNWGPWNGGNWGLGSGRWWGGKGGYSGGYSLGGPVWGGNVGGVVVPVWKGTYPRFDYGNVGYGYGVVGKNGY
ncbi:hypothetical protein CHS0354_032747 [Potamilus streckersoni]|uniref:Uncharacterized protein n=1 Tax=Potamilus streckersoni TaxID=2493646 RepID=A0AAE0TJC6_9BIVA|nr:hypothetical protein CHS0354_032747 [Potamilus streckersoni]